MSLVERFRAKFHPNCQSCNFYVGDYDPTGDNNVQNQKTLSIWDIGNSGLKLRYSPPENIKKGEAVVCRVFTEWDRCLLFENDTVIIRHKNPLICFQCENKIK